MPHRFGITPDGKPLTEKDAINNIQLLFAEDDPDDQEMIRRAVRKMGLENSVYFVKDGVEAMEFISATGRYAQRSKHFLPKAVVLDIKMPKMGGLEVLNKLRHNDATKNVPVIMLTSSPADYDRRESYKQGANSYVVKPFSFEDFQKTVTDIVNFWVNHNRPHE